MDGGSSRVRRDTEAYTRAGRTRGAGTAGERWCGVGGKELVALVRGPSLLALSSLGVCKSTPPM